jgi:hypothetical protein
LIPKATLKGVVAGEKEIGIAKVAAGMLELIS